MNDSPLTIRVLWLPVLLLCILTWMLTHAYQGIVHDANLYTLQALARLHADSLANDVFLRFGSQDRLTVFSPAYAIAIRLFGVDYAAALLTLGSQAAVFAAAWWLARAVLPSEYALLGLFMVVAVPGEYGAGRIFTVIEPFLTPRMGAEALGLAALAASFSGRRGWSLALLSAAMLLHPVMAAGCAVAWLALFVVLPHPRSGLWLILVTGTWLMIAFFALRAGEWGRLNSDWLTLAAQRSPYLFLSFWNLDDWGRAAVSLTVLMLGSFTLDNERARLLCRASALTTIGGFALTGLACDVLHLTLFTQAQPWRWQWLGTVVAALVLPSIIVVNWNRRTSGRVTALLAIAAWISGGNDFAITLCATVLLSLAFGRLRPRELRIVLIGSCALLGLAVIWRIASNLEFTDMHYMNAALPAWLRGLLSFVHDGFAPETLLCLVAWAACRSRWITRLVCVPFATAAMLGLAPFAWSAWTQQEFPRAQLARFAPWRDLVAPHDEVFWAESPLSTWVLLGRPSYISSLQTSGMIFSRTSALELERRALTLRDFIGPQTFLSWSGAGAHLSISPEVLGGICRLGTFGYLVTSANLAGLQPVSVIDRLKLYRCAAAAAAAT